MKPINRFLHRSGIPEERDPIAVVDRFVSIGNVGVVAATDLGDETTSWDLVVEFSDGSPGDMFSSNFNFDDVMAVAEVIHPARQRWPFNLVVQRIGGRLRFVNGTDAEGFELFDVFVVVNPGVDSFKTKLRH